LQFELTILGCNAAIPAYDRHPSSQVLDYNGNLFMIDCGEGTQFRMMDFGVKRAKLDNVFISHLHGDHFFGLVPLLTSLNLNWREHPLNLYGPPGLQEIINLHFKHANTQLKYDIHFHPVLDDAPRIIYEDHLLSVETLILKHRLPTTGYLFKEKKHLRKIIADKIQQYNIPHQYITDIKKGANFTDANGNVIPNTELTADPPLPRSYAYCSDTAYNEDIVAQLKGVSVLYHEATFVDEHKFRAQETLHSTSIEAATIAKMAVVEKLVIGHFSARYEDLSILLAEARSIFPETYLAKEGETFTI
jgi:ribonuclease Z